VEPRACPAELVPVAAPALPVRRPVELGGEVEVRERAVGVLGAGVGVAFGVAAASCGADTGETPVAAPVREPAWPAAPGAAFAPAGFAALPPVLEPAFRPPLVLAGEAVPCFLTACVGA
jgi:hypothetical protein